MDPDFWPLLGQWITFSCFQLLFFFHKCGTLNKDINCLNELGSDSFKLHNIYNAATKLA